MLENIRSVLRQVDRLYLVLNQYDRIPDEVSGNDRIVAVIPDDDLMDVGKFYFQPEPDDLVFTMDDDLVYPDDYVSHMLSFAKTMDFNKDIISLHGLSVDPTQASGWRYFHFRQGLKAIRGVTRIGTGVGLMRGVTCPPLSAMRGAEGFVDIRFAQWQLAQENLLWVVPHARGWVKGNAPAELAKHSLTERFLFRPTPKIRDETKMLLQSKAAHDGLRYHAWRRQGKEDQST